MIPLTRLQKEIMTEFYSKTAIKVVLNKSKRNKLWKLATAKSEIDILDIEGKCPALAHQILKSYQSGSNIQSAVFSECVYAQTLANLFNLDRFVNCLENHSFLSEEIQKLLKSYNLVPRYVYANSNNSRMLIQAGGCDGIDSALITVIDLDIYTIEFKEPKAKTCEPDLPKYKENGKLVITKTFKNNYPQFTQMLKEQRKLNFFNKMGSNENDFSNKSVNIAVTNNYVKKYADVICTEDMNGFLIMLPVNQISLWANIVGEIRPAGRNHYKVWTPNALKKYIIEKGGTIDNNTVTIEKSNLVERKERGGNGKISGYKINSIFFVYKKHCTEQSNLLKFELDKVQQLNPTISAKIYFKPIKYDDIKNYYFNTNKNNKANQ